MRRTLAAGIAAALTTAVTAIAHDFWIAPTAFRARPGDLIGLNLLVGHLDEKESFPRRQERIERFIVATPSGEVRDVLGREGGTPAGIIRVADPGMYVVGYRGTPTEITMEAEKFEAYLTEEGLESVIEARAAAGRSSQPGRELFSRAAKSLVVAGDVSPRAGYDRVLGLRLELVPEVDPFALAPGAEFRVRAIFEDRPLEGLLIRARRAEAPTEALTARTDVEGRARLVLPAEGHWLVTAVHMTAVEKENADWESTWASLTFQAGNPTPVKPAAPGISPAAK